MLFGETPPIQIDSASLIAGLTAAGGAVAGGIVGAARLLMGVIRQLHQENREDRDKMMQVLNSQWEHLNRLAQNTRVNAQAARSIQRKIGADPVPADDEVCP